MNVVLFSTGCPKCSVLKKKLTDGNIEYIENNSVDEMLKLGIRQAPMLSVDGKIMDFKEAIAWVKENTK